MTGSPCELGVRKGRWGREEDWKLIAYVQRYGHWNRNYVPIFAGLSRSGKSCRFRWKNYLRPNLKLGDFSTAEEEVITKMQHELGNRWSEIASKLPGRTDNDIKNLWITRLKKQKKHRSSSPSGSSNSVGIGLEETTQMLSPQLSNLPCSSFSSFDQTESVLSNSITEAAGTGNIIASDPFDEWFVELGMLLEDPF